jgi:hypothetical protein
MPLILSVAMVHASVLVPSMFMEHGPQMPSRQGAPEGERRIDDVLDPDQRVQHHWRAIVEIDEVGVHARVVRVEQRVVRDEKGEPVEVIGSSSDITARKQVEEAAAAARERLSTLLETVPAVIYSFKACQSQPAASVSSLSSPNSPFQLRARRGSGGISVSMGSLTAGRCFTRFGIRSLTPCG